MNKKEFIEWLLRAYPHFQSAQDEADKYSATINANWDFKDLKLIIQREWEKTSPPPPKWLLERKTNAYQVTTNPFDGTWKIYGKKNGYIYDWTCTKEQKLSEMKDWFFKENIEYIKCEKDAI